MAEQVFRYDAMVEEALRGVARKALRQVAAHGLPGNHHFYITFRTRHPGVRIPPYLADKYPDEITIVLQYQFWSLDVREDRFEVGLSFNDRRERLSIPFAAMTGFADPSVKFGLHFQAGGEAAGEEPDAAGAADGDPAGDGADAPPAPGEVVSLDRFRKKR